MSYLVKINSTLKCNISHICFYKRLFTLFDKDKPYEVSIVSNSIFGKDYSKRYKHITDAEKDFNYLVENVNNLKKIFYDFS